MGKVRNRDRFEQGPNCDSNCVQDIVKRIFHAQKEVTGENCDSSCNNSIQQLLNQKHKGRVEPIHTTIPFILYNQGACDPFIGSGVVKCHDGNRNTHFECIESPVFRVKDVSEHNSCAKLELLLPARGDCPITMNTDSNCYKSVCSFFPIDQPVTDFIASGVCITVDLDKFVAISCLDPITPLYTD